jgi:glutamate formiminotransferase
MHDKYLIHRRLKETATRNMSAAFIYDVSRQVCPILSIEEISPETNIWQLFHWLNKNLKEYVYIYIYLYEKSKKKKRFF